MKLAIVEAWHAAVAARDVPALLATCAEDVELVGPRGVARGRAVFAGWLERAGFSAEVTRWFCGTQGRVVVGQRARWHGGEPLEVASSFVVEDGHITRYERFDDLAGALAAAGLAGTDEVGRILQV